MASPGGASASSRWRGRSPSWEPVSSIGPGLATVELLISVVVFAALSPVPKASVWASTCISSDGMWIVDDLATVSIGSLPVVVGACGGVDVSCDFSPLAAIAAPRASRATWEPLCSGSFPCSSGCRSAGLPGAAAVVVICGDRCLDREDSPGNGDVRNPALAIELRFDSGFEVDCFRKEMGSGGLDRTELDVPDRGLEMATGSLLLGCIGPAMNVPYLAPAWKG